MKTLKAVVIFLGILLVGALSAQTTVFLGNYVNTDRFCASDYGGQETIYFEPTTGYLVTGAMENRESIHGYVSLDGGSNWTHIPAVNGPGEVRMVTVSGDANIPIFVYSKRGETPTGALWARHITYLASDDFGWGGGSFSETPIATEGTQADVMDSYSSQFDLSPFDPNLRGILAHHGSSQEGGEYQQFFYSLDGGQTWSDRIKIVSSADADTLENFYVADLSSNSADFQYGPDGIILAAGVADFDFDNELAEHLWYAVSTDSGKTWGAVNLIPGSENIDVDWKKVDRGYKVFLDGDNNFHVFALGANETGVFGAYDFKLVGSDWTMKRFVEPQLLDVGLVAIESEFGDAAPLNAPTLNSDGTIFYSFIDVADNTGGVNDYRLYTVYSKDGGDSWSGRVELLDDPDFNAEEFVDVARNANDKLHITYCKIDTNGTDVVTSQYYAQVPTDAIIQGKQEILVQAGTDQISAAYAGAAAGDVLILVTDGGEYIENDSLVIDKAVTIKAADGLSSRPVWTTLDSTQNIYLQTDLMLQGISFNGGDTTAAAVFCNAPTPNKLLVDGCEFHSYKNDIIDAANTTTVDTAIVKHCRFHHSGDEGVEFQGDRTGDFGPKIPGIHFLSVENCTFNALVGDGIKVYGESDGADSAIVVVSHITVYECERGIYFRGLAQGTAVTNSIITNCDQGVRMRDSHALEVTYSDIWGNNEDFANDASAATGTISEDPLFADAANGDFDLVEGSPCIDAADDGKNMGDTNWGVAMKPVEPKEIEVSAGTDQISAAYAGALAGDVLILVTDGGEYIESDSLIIDKAVTIRAAAGLNNRPVWTTLDSTQNIYLLSNLTLQGIVFEGDSLTRAAVYCNAPALYNLLVDGCEFRNYADDIIDASNTTTADSVTITHCCFRHSGDEGVEFQGDRKGDYGPKRPGVHHLLVENCTFNALVGDAIKAYGASDGGDSAVAVISHVTICGGERGVYFRSLAHGTIVTNSIITGCEQGVRMRDTYLLEVTYSDLWNNTENYANDTAAGTGTISEDPLFSDPANADFDLMEGSPCINTAGDGLNMGDTNWGVNTSVDSETKMKLSYALLKNYPNPFNPQTMIGYQLPERVKVRLVVYNLMGQKIATLYEGFRSAGSYSVKWNGLNDQGKAVASGLYLYRLEAGSFISTAKMMLMK